MEEQNKNQMPQGKTCNCACGYGCGCGMHGRWALRLVRWLLAIAILIIVFSMGVKLGELKAELNRGYGYNLMGGYGRAYPMMQGVPSSTMPGSAQY